MIREQKIKKQKIKKQAKCAKCKNDVEVKAKVARRYVHGRYPGEWSGYRHSGQLRTTCDCGARLSGRWANITSYSVDQMVDKIVADPGWWLSSAA